MSIPFLSKFVRLNTPCHFLRYKILNESPTNFHKDATQLYHPVEIVSPAIYNIDRSKAHLLPVLSYCYSYIPYIRRFYSSSPTSPPGSDDNEKRLPCPACASLPQDFMTRPLEEHEVGLKLTRRGRSKTPLNEDISVDKLPTKKDKKSKRYKVPTPYPHPTTPAPSPIKSSSYPSRTRANDRLEALDKHDRHRRVLFALKLLLVVEDEPEILDNILWTDECNFNLPKLASIITKPPIAESELLPQIAWCGMSTKGTVGPYFFNSYVTDKSYVKMLEEYLVPELERKGYNLKELWFQQDGAPWHRSKLVLDFLTSVFGYRIISLGTNFIWPPRSQDLTPMDYFFWDYMKVKLDFKHSKYDLCFQKSFREILTREVNTTSLNTLQGALYQLPERLEMCMNENGHRFSHLLYPDRYEKDGTRKPRKLGEELTPLKKSSKETCSNTASRAIDSASKILEKEEKTEISSSKSTTIPPISSFNEANENNSNANLPSHEK